MFGVARLYAGAGLVADVLARHPGVRVELIGQNSSEVQDDLRRGRLEAAMIAHPAGDQRGHGGDPRSPATSWSTSAPTRSGWPRRSPPKRLAQASLVMPDTTWRAEDSVRILLRQMLHEAGLNPQTRIEVEDPEIAVELVGMGLADSVHAHGRGRAAAPPAGAERRVGVAAAAALRHVRDRAPGRRDPVPRRPADDRARRRSGSRRSREPVRAGSAAVSR